MRQAIESSHYNTELASDYVDFDGILNPIKEIIKNDLFDGMAMGITVADILKKYTLTDDVFGPYRSMYELKTIDVTPDYKLILAAQKSDKISSRVSDGWWGYTDVLNKGASINNFVLILSLPSQYDEKHAVINKKIAEAFNLDGLSDSYGDLYITIGQGEHKQAIYIYVEEELSDAAKKKSKKESDSNPRRRI